jgi:hypothetical protein
VFVYKEKKPNAAIKMLAMNQPEVLFIIVGCISCIISGGIQPAFGIVLSKLTAVSDDVQHRFMDLFFFTNDKVFQECDYDVQQRLVVRYVLIFIGFAILMLITTFLQVGQS